MADERPAGSSTAPQKKYLKYGYLIVAVCGVIAFVLPSLTDVTIGVSEGFAPFAVIYIVAQAVERIIQPFTTFTVKADEKEKTKANLAQTRAALAATTDDAKAQTETKVTEKQKELDQINADRAMVYWAAATALSLLICGALGLGLIESVADITGPWWIDNLDVVVTGIAIGSGTKPLHDVISFIRNTKENSDPKTVSA